MMDKAITTDKKNPLPMYHKASILVTLGNFNEALEVLEDLKELAPQESCIHALMGEIYRQCQMYDKAILHFGTALDLKPSASDVAKLKVCFSPSSTFLMVMCTFLQHSCSFSLLRC